MKSWDAVVIGAGIIGLAHAYAFAKRGQRVLVIERSPVAQGASVRNFGMIWTIGQREGLPTAQVSNRVWREVLADSEIWHDPCGSLHLAYEDLEMEVLKEWFDQRPDCAFDQRLVSPTEIQELAPSVKTAGLKGGLYSAQEVSVDPRETLRRLPDYLASKQGVEFRFSTAAIRCEPGRITLGNGETLQAKYILMCTGDDYETLYPVHFQSANLSRCRLNMLRAEPENGWKIGPMLCAGLTLGHYANFQICPSIQNLKDQHRAAMPELVDRGIHVLASQHGMGEITLGDSHTYGLGVTPFSDMNTDDLILDYLNTFLPVDRMKITQRWHGVYSTTDGSLWHEAEVEPGVHVRTGIGGAGMTLSMGWGERTASRLLEGGI